MGRPQGRVPLYRLIPLTRGFNKFFSRQALGYDNWADKKGLKGLAKKGLAKKDLAKKGLAKKGLAKLGGFELEFATKKLS